MSALINAALSKIKSIFNSRIAFSAILYNSKLIRLLLYVKDHGFTELQ